MHAPGLAVREMISLLWTDPRRKSIGDIWGLVRLSLSHPPTLLSSGLSYQLSTMQGSHCNLNHTAHSQRTKHTEHCALHTAHCKLHTAHCTLRTAHCTLHTVHCTLHTADCTLRTAHCTLHTANSAHCTLHTAQCTLHTLHTAHCTLHTAHCTPLHTTQ